MLLVVSVALFMSVLVWFNYSAVLPLIVEEWGLSGVRAGIIFAAFQAGYLVTIVPMGMTADRYSARWTIAGGAVGTGVFSLLFALVAEGFLMGTALRFASGLFMTGVYVPGMRFLSDWYPIEDRGTAIGLYVGTFSIERAFISRFVGGCGSRGLGNSHHRDQRRRNYCWPNGVHARPRPLRSLANRTGA
jgi:MFS family permease